jgi:hypothetical protein
MKVEVGDWVFYKSSFLRIKKIAEVCGWTEYNYILRNGLSLFHIEKKDILEVRPPQATGRTGKGEA